LVGGVARVLGHLDGMRRLALRHERRHVVVDGRALVAPLRALTLRLPRGALGARVAGTRRALPQRVRGGRREVWFDLPRGRMLRLELLGAGGRPLALLEGRGVELR
jgi:hypothetical protein